MVRITVEDLPVLEELTQEEMADIVGGGGHGGGGGQGGFGGGFLGDTDDGPRITSVGTGN
jgi:hypothetical protein